MLKIVLILLFGIAGSYLAHADVKTDYARLTSSDDIIIQQANAQIAQMTNAINTLTKVIANAQMDKDELNVNLNAVISANAVISSNTVISTPELGP